MRTKSFFVLVPLAASMLLSCKSSVPASTSVVQSSQSTTTSLEGEKVNVETTVFQGIEMADALNDDGTNLIKRPFKWYAGIGKADQKQMAVELAQREAYATISRVLNNVVKDESERGNIANNGKVQQALRSHWEQFSNSITKACEPFGATRIEYSQTTKMYTATAKVAIRGDRFNQLLNSAGNFKPKDLSNEELEEFVRVNKSIMEAAKGN